MERLNRFKRIVAVLTVGVLLFSGFFLSFGNTASGLEDKKTIYLTFDDGPHPIFTPLLLSLLDENGAKATFFPIGSRLEERWVNDDLQDLLNRGHAIGNHSWNHRDLTEEKEDGLKFQLEQSSVQTEIMSGLRPNCFRAPFGERNQKVLESGKTLGMKHVAWTVDPQEWNDTSIDKAMVHIVKRFEDGAVVLLHDRRFLALPIVREIFKTFPSDQWSYETLPDCRNGDEKHLRSNMRKKGDVPIGKIINVRKVGPNHLFTGWAYDPDSPEGDLQVFIQEPNNQTEHLIKTDSQHGFTFEIPDFEIDGPICLWLKNEGPSRHNTFIGCHNADK
jgi:peptidoglycan/xylan/chitin deacetylase (PgdA/CDA1 family)